MGREEAVIECDFMFFYIYSIRDLSCDGKQRDVTKEPAVEPLGRHVCVCVCVCAPAV